MIKNRLIPKLLLKTSEFNINKLVVVVTKQYTRITEIGNPVSQAKIFQDQGADELIFLNIDRNNKDINSLCKVIEDVSQEIFMPLTVGGGVKSEEHFKLLLNSGADKISINTQAILSPELITKASEKYGAQCVVVGIDYKRNNSGDLRVYIDNGTFETKKHPLDWAVECEKYGAGEILLSSIDNDGMNIGLDLEVTRVIATTLGIPVIASGGCALAKHFSEGILLGKADAIAAGSFFALRDQNFIQTRAQIKNSGVNIRVNN